MQLLKNVTLLLGLGFASLCLSDTALGQNLTVSDSSMTVIASTSMSPGTTGALTYSTAFSTQLSQNLTSFAQQTNGQPLPTTMVLAVNSGSTGQLPSWLRLSAGNCNAVTVCNINTDNAGMLGFSVNINPAGLGQGQYQGSFFVAINSLANSKLTINVTLNVNGGTVISANPTSMQFTAIQGSTTASPSSQNLVINSTLAGITFNLTPQINSGGTNWLKLPGGTTNLNPGSNNTVVADPSNLSAGTYTGNIIVNATSGDQLQVPVTLTVTTTSTITITPANPAPFLYQVGGQQPPAAQTISVTTTSSTTIPFSLTSNASWLVPNALSGFAQAGSPANISVAANVGGLGVGTYDTTITFFPQGANSISIPFRLVITTNPVLYVTPNTMTFSAPFAGQNPASQNAQVTASGSGATINFTTSTNASWLTVTANQNFVSSGNPATISVSVNQANMSVGTYTGVITVTPNTGDNYNQSINVTLVVGSTSTLNAGPSTLLFSFQTTKSPPAEQQVQLQTTGQNVSFTFTAVTNNCGSGWLLVTPTQFSTPATLRVNVQAGSLPVGTCTGKITVTPASGQPLDIPITVAVSANALLILNQGQGFGYAVVPLGGTPPTQSLTIVSTDNTAIPVNVSADVSWLAIAGTQVTPQNVQVFYSTAGLAPGTYTGNITIASANALPGGFFTIPVKLIINPNVTVTVTPNTLSFSVIQNGTLPASQSVVLSNSSGGNPTFLATVNSDCSSLIGVTPTSGSAAGTLTVSVLRSDTNVAQFNCSITLTYQNAATQSAVIPVTVNVTAARTINIPLTPLTFNYQISQAQPAPQKISITANGGSVQFNVATTSSGWLSTDTTTGNTPRDVTVSVSPGSLGVGEYSGQVVITAPGVLASSVPIEVKLKITAAPNPQPTVILSTASNQAGNIAPGALLTIKGTLLGPATPANGVLFSLNAQGGINPTLAGVRVLFSGIPGTPIFVSATQINVFAPYEIAGRFTADIVVEYQNISSAPIQVRVNEVAPAIFTLNQQGFGQAAVLNQNSTFNGPPGSTTIPAPVNTVIGVYFTGCGQTNPPSSTGGVASSTVLQRVQGTATASIAGLPATVEFAGSAPGLASGVCQGNIRVPTPPIGAPPISGPQPITITINGVSSPAGPTVYIQ